MLGQNDKMDGSPQQTFWSGAGSSNVSCGLAMSDENGPAEVRTRPILFGGENNSPARAHTTPDFSPPLLSIVLCRCIRSNKEATRALRTTYTAPRMVV